MKLALKEVGAPEPPCLGLNHVGYISRPLAMVLVNKCCLPLAVNIVTSDSSWPASFLST